VEKEKLRRERKEEERKRKEEEKVDRMISNMVFLTVILILSLIFQ